MSENLLAGLAGQTILIVDDMPTNLTLMVPLLEQQGFGIAVAQDGEEAIERATLLMPDMILLDVMLPGMNGFDACRRLKAAPATRDIPVIFMTALDGIADKITGFAAGGIDYVTKPLQLEEVLARVATHLRLAQMQRQLEAQNALLAGENLERRRAQSELQRYRDSLEQQVAERTTELRELEAHRETVREDERKHIARELHDELGQSLTALRMTSSMLRVRFGRQTPGLAEHVKNMTELVDRTIEVVRNVATTLRPSALDLGISLALEWLAREFGRSSGIACVLELDMDGVELEEHQAVAVFRIVQESLTNVARHAGAGRVRIALRAQDGACRLVVSDSGKGFEPARRRGKNFGLLGIRERVHMLGGELTVRSAPGEGTSIEVSIPLPGARPVQ